MCCNGQVVTVLPLEGGVLTVTTGVIHLALSLSLTSVVKKERLITIAVRRMGRHHVLMGMCCNGQALTVLPLEGGVLTVTTGVIHLPPPSPRVNHPPPLSLSLSLSPPPPNQRVSRPPPPLLSLSLSPPPPNQ